MKARIMIVGGITLLTGCGPRDELQHQTVEAYQADTALRANVLQRCANHITNKVAFRTDADTDECRKALVADQNARLAEHLAREAAASNGALNNAAKQFEGH